MNSKLISYEEAVKQLKVLESRQRKTKSFFKWTGNKNNAIHQKVVSKRIIEINILLSIIAAHKQARRLYGILRDVQDKLGLSTKERELVDGVLNER